MEPEREAMRLSALIALCVGAFIITLSIDNFRQEKLPGRIGEVDCTWLQTKFTSCVSNQWSLQDVTGQTRKLSFKL